MALEQTNNLILIDETNLLALVDKLDAMRESRKSAGNVDADKFLTKKEVMNILKVSATKVWRMTKDGKLPAHNLGSSRSLRYKLSDVLNLSEGNL